jgi:hypothetical protein
MVAAIVVAVISAVVAAGSAIWTTRSQLRLKRLEVAWDDETRRRAAETEAAKVLARHREPLTAAAYELQRRLHNILEDGFLAYLETEQCEEAVESTAFRFAQYFGWSELFRRNIQVLTYGEDTRRVLALQGAIAKTFASGKEKWGPPFRIWADRQRAIGEEMIVEEHGQVLCMGYGRYATRRDEELRFWVDPLADEVSSLAVHQSPRLAEVQNLLCDLVEELDQHRVWQHAPLKRVPRPTFVVVDPLSERAI